MNRTKSITVEAVAGSYQPIDANALKQALCEVVGKCADRPLSTYDDAITTAAEALHLAYPDVDAEDFVPLIRLTVGGLQLSQSLVGAFDLEDAEKFAHHLMEQAAPFFAAWVDGKYAIPTKVGDTHIDGELTAGMQLWNALAQQAMDVLRGKFDDGLGQIEDTERDLEEEMADLLQRGGSIN